MADNLANAARILSRATERLTTQVSNTAESNPSSSVGPSMGGWVFEDGRGIEIAIYNGQPQILVLMLGVLIEAWLEFSIMRLAVKMS